MKIIKKNAGTEYGRRCSFSAIRTIADFQRTVPVTTYNEMMPYIERMGNGEENILCCTKPAIYLMTSGTVAKPKFIPLTESSIKNGQKLSQLLWMHHLCRNHPSFLGGKALLILSKPVEGHMADGTPYGSATGTLRKKLPGIMDGKCIIPPFVSEIKDYNAKYYCVLRLALETDDITYFGTANPSTIALICRKMQEWAMPLIDDIANGTLSSNIAVEDEYREIIVRGAKPNPRRAEELSGILKTHGSLTPRHVWPRLKTVGCWTRGNAVTFLDSLYNYMSEDLYIHDIGYLASELKGSVPIKKHDPSGVLALADTFFEFVDIEEWSDDPDWRKVHFKLAHELETGKKYFLFITSTNGLYRYDINDIVQVTGFHNTVPEIVFLQKGKGVTSITGEKLYESQAVAAVEMAKKELPVNLYFYMLIANIQESRYELVAEFDGIYPQNLLNAFGRSVDENLQTVNVEYAAKRKSLRLGEMNLRRLLPGEFDRYKFRKVKEGQREGQFKMVLLSNDLSLLDQFSFMDGKTHGNVLKKSAASTRSHYVEQWAGISL